MPILPQQPSSIPKILDASFKLFAASFTKVIGFGLILSVLYIVLTVLSVNLAASLPVSTDPVEAQPMPFPNPLNLVWWGAGFLVITLLSFILYAAIVYRIDNIAQQREDSFGEALGVGLKKFPAMLAALILYSLAVAVGSLLLLVPGIVLMLSLAFYPLFIVIEDLGGYAALKASHRLVWGHWWRTLSVYMAPGILAMIVYIALGLLAYPLSGEANQAGAVNAGDILSNLLSAVVMPYFYVLAYVVYHDLKLRKSGGDIAARLAD